MVDNPWLMENQSEYLHSLESLPDIERRRLLLGDWTARESSSSYFPSGNNILIAKGDEVWSLRRWCDKLELDYKNAYHRFKYRGESVGSILGGDYTLED